MREHDLKTWPEPFRAIMSGEKRYEIRRNDRAYAVGDVLHLREFEPNGKSLSSLGSYTGQSTRVCVTYMTEGGAWGLPPDLCVMSIEPVRP